MKNLFSLLQKGKTPRPDNVRRDPPKILWQHQWSIAETQEATSESKFGNLPNEILLQIFRHLSVHELGQVALVCRLFKIISSHGDVWKFKCSSNIYLNEEFQF